MEFEVTGLLPGSTYTIAVRAKNKFGTSECDNDFCDDNDRCDDNDGFFIDNRRNFEIARKKYKN